MDGHLQALCVIYSALWPGPSSEVPTFAAVLNPGSSESINMVSLPCSKSCGKPVFEVKNEGSMREEIDILFSNLIVAQTTLDEMKDNQAYFCVSTNNLMCKTETSGAR